MSYYWQIIGCINPLSTWSKFMNRKKKAIEQRDMVTTKANLEKTIKIVDAKIESYESKIKDLRAEIKELMANKKKHRALTLFKKMKRLESTIAFLEKQWSGIDKQNDTIDMVWMQQNVISGIKEYVKSTDGMISDKTLKELDGMMEKLGEANDGANKFDINVEMLMNTTGAVKVEDEMELLKEFEDTYMEQESTGDLLIDKRQQEPELEIEIIPERKIKREFEPAYLAT